MDKLTNYRNLMKRILSEYVELSNRQPQPGIESILIMDEARGHYVWLKLGWEDGKRAKYITRYEAKKERERKATLRGGDRHNR